MTPFLANNSDQRTRGLFEESSERGAAGIDYCNSQVSGTKYQMYTVKSKMRHDIDFSLAVELLLKEL